MKKSLLFYISIFTSLFYISSVSAQNITVSYPTSVLINQEFSFRVLLSNFEQGIYDIKIDVLGEGTRVAKILNNGLWKSTYYYINNAISSNEEKEFKLRIDNYVGTSNIEIKIRKSGTTNVIGTFSGYNIESKPPVSSDNGQEQTEEEEQNLSIDDISSNLTSQQTEQVDNSTLTTQRGILNLSKDIKSKDNFNKLNGDYAIYWLIAFSILIIILFILRKNKYKNEFRHTKM